MEPRTTNFGARLRSLIDRKGITIVQFAKQFPLSESNLHKWLKRSAPPLEKHWPKLASFFGVSESYIAYGTPNLEEPLGAGVRVDEAPQSTRSKGAAAELRRGVTRQLDDLLAHAGDDVGRLGWVREQMLKHLAIPEHWGVHEKVLRDVLRDAEALERAEAESAQLKSGKPSQGGVG